MRRRANWIASGLFFLAGCAMLAVPALVRGLLYAADSANGSWTYPNEMIERVVPGYLRLVGLLAFALSGAALVVPFLARTLSQEDDSREE